ncbi:hypothetical protein BLA39750_01089 [Burkholderia lata]|uniref:Uncharacterized protein n=1 Tax=Burkholderia lata (strain ATCC 17760 / DSM 23089 / LMG 22485 / NCIMB 9086 / R18194 / 383) TaxID=482957 RepID=A0A6P2VCX5_BURL3|nr:hypothetical protein [Burkholderia lata]VWC79493.1 hypothetical protein BLA39750_01089 [Burkholderia lata]
MTARPNKIKNIPPPGKKLIRDWIDMRVRTKEVMRNGYVEIPAGSTATVAGIGVGLELKFDPCTCCGMRAFITRVHGSAVEPASTSPVPAIADVLMAISKLADSAIALGGEKHMRATLDDIASKLADTAVSLTHQSAHVPSREAPWAAAGTIDKAIGFRTRVPGFEWVPWLTDDQDSIRRTIADNQSQGFEAEPMFSRPYAATGECADGRRLYTRLQTAMPDWYPDQWEDLLPKFQHAYSTAAGAGGNTPGAVSDGEVPQHG